MRGACFMGFSWDRLLVAGGRAFHEEQSLPGGKGKVGRPRLDFPRPGFFFTPPPSRLCSVPAPSY